MSTTVAKGTDPHYKAVPPQVAPMPRAYLVPEPVQRLLQRLLSARIHQEYWACKRNPEAIYNWVEAEVHILEELTEIIVKLERYAAKNPNTRPAHACYWLIRYIAACD